MYTRLPVGETAKLTDAVPSMIGLEGYRWVVVRRRSEGYPGNMRVGDANDPDVGAVKCV